MKKLILMIFITLTVNVLSQTNIYENRYSIYQEFDSTKAQYNPTAYNVNINTQIDLDNHKVVIGDKDIEHTVFTIKSSTVYSNLIILKCLNEPMNILCTVKLYNDTSYHVFEVVYTECNRFKYKQLIN